MILSLPVYPRANRIALIAASVPELTNLIFSMYLWLESMSVANSFSNRVGAPKLLPLDTDSVTAATTFLGACPKMRGPQEQQ